MLEIVQDPIKFGKLLWPDVSFYREQRQIIYSVRDDEETFVSAGNMLGDCPLLCSPLAMWFIMEGAKAKTSLLDS